jgi:hypothetical protein
MHMAKKTSLSDALSQAASGPVTAKVAPADAVPAKPTGAGASAKLYRQGRVNVTGYFDPAVKQSIRLIQAQRPTRVTEQELLAEALNDLFAKYNVPQTATLKTKEFVSSQTNS